jgi:hypothetical protein
MGQYEQPEEPALPSEPRWATDRDLDPRSWYGSEDPAIFGRRMIANLDRVLGKSKPSVARSH